MDTTKSKGAGVGVGVGGGVGVHAAAVIAEICSGEGPHPHIRRANSTTSMKVRDGFILVSFGGWDI